MARHFLSVEASRRRARRSIRPGPVLEALETRTLLSRVLLTPVLPSPAPPLTPPTPPTPPISVPISFPGAGVTLHEQAAVPFSAVVGSFITPAPGTNLQATINWGDGSNSPGTIVASGVLGVDVLKYNVVGSHTYAKDGTFPIVAIVSQSLGPPRSLAPIRLITTIHSTAIVGAASSLNLSGTLTGKYLLAPTAAILGALYIFTGTGNAGAVGPVSVSGRVQLPGLTPVPLRATTIALPGNATGTLTLSSISASPLAGGSVTLQVVGPAQTALGPFPSVLAFTITGGTGAYANATGTGTIGVVLDPLTQAFTFVIHSFQAGA